jgi:hypothetical protein
MSDTHTHTHTLIGWEKWEKIHCCNLPNTVYMCVQYRVVQQQLASCSGTPTFSRSTGNKVIANLKALQPRILRLESRPRTR